MSVEPQPFDDPDVVAVALAGCPLPLLVATDVDGTLSPIVDSPAQARLLPGVGVLLSRLAEVDGVDVAVVSGRSFAELRTQFALPAGLHLVGSHGAETEHQVPPTDAEAALLAEVIGELQWLAAETPGSRVERKPLAGALHVRSCAREHAREGVERARSLFGGRGDLAIHEGHQVYEVAVRPTNKAAAVTALRERIAPAAVVFLGDDTSDETVFEVLRPPDVGVKVGTGATAAQFRVAAPLHVVHVLTSVLERLAD